MSSTDKTSFSDKVNQVFVTTLYYNPEYSEAIDKVINPKVKNQNQTEKVSELEKEDEDKSL